MKANNIPLSQREVRRLFSYSEETGILTWLVAAKNNAHLIGHEAGCQHSRGYRHVSIQGSLYMTHRIIFLWMTGKQPNQVDHINHDRSDNKWANLQASSNLKNSHNQSMFSTNTSGIVGVSWFSIGKQWHARIGVNGKKIHLGCFDNIEDAACARLIAENNHGFHRNHGRTAPELEEQYK